MSIDTPIPEEARGEMEKRYDPQVYFKEVIEVHREKEDREKGGARKRIRPEDYRGIGNNMKGILQKRPDILEGFMEKEYRAKTKEDRHDKKRIDLIRDSILTGKFSVDNDDIVVSMALDEEGNITDSEIVRAYLDDKMKEIHLSIEKLRQEIEKAEKGVEVNQAKLEQWNKLLELAAAGLENETPAQKAAAGEIIQELNDLRNKAEEAVEKARQSKERTEEYRGTIGSLTEEIERLEKIKANVQ